MADEFEDYYQLLQLKPGASEEEISQMYRAMTKLFHPDKHDGVKWSHRAMSMLNRAKETLLDVEKRAEYDERWHRYHDPPSSHRPAPPTPPSTPRTSASRTRRPAPPRSPPPPRKNTESDLAGDLFKLLLGGAAAYAVASVFSNSYDSGTGRYRRGDGTFASGKWG